VNAVRRLLERGADPTIRDEDGWPQIHLAAGSDKDFEILNLLVESGKVDINETTTEYGWTALYMAVMDINTATAEFLLSKGANPNVTDVHGRTPLHLAAWYAKDMDIVELLLNHKDVDVNLMDDDGRNALDYAMENKEGNGERIANLLKEKGAVEREKKLPKGNNESFEDSLEKLLNYTSRNAKDEIENVLSDATVPLEDQIARINEEHLISAIEYSNVESVRRLLKNGADISRARGEDGMNALHVASLYAETTDLIDVILETGKLDINGVDNNGWTPLHWAINKTSYSKVNAGHLIRKGADPTIANKEGDTPLHWAASHAEEIETINLILENDQVDINSRNKNGWTALHRAIRASNVITLRYLLKKGADPNAADENGATPLHLAAETNDYYYENTELIDIILETGKCNINGVDNDGRTPLHYASGRLYYSPATINARHLIEMGADPGIADKNGVTPLHMTAKNAVPMDLIDELLLKVKTGAVDIKGLIPLTHARYNKHGPRQRIIDRLKKYGAKE
jgi:ankyrin repeat protein